MEVSKISDTAPQPSAKPALRSVPDRKGRNFTLKKLKPSERYLLAKAVDMSNLSTTMQAMAVASVYSIDDEGFTPIRSEKDLLARLDQIGDEGLEAIMPLVMEMYGTTMSAEDATAAKN